MNLLLFLPDGNDYLATYFVSLIFGFLIGSIPFGYIIARIKGIDIRNYGSKNIGFNNVNRVLGSLFGVPVLILDIAKGFLPVFFSNQLDMVGALVGLGTILGHSYTPWLGFRGGKSVATTIGVMSALIPYALVGGIGVFIIFALIFSYISLASLSFAVSLPLFAILFYQSQILILILTIFTAILILLRHKDNIKRIINKTEPKIMFSKYFKTKR